MRSIEIEKPSGKFLAGIYQVQKRLGVLWWPFTAIAVLVFTIGCIAGFGLWKLGQLGKRILNWLGIDPHGVW